MHILLKTSHSFYYEILRHRLEPLKYMFINYFYVNLCNDISEITGKYDVKKA